mmetsp:Transcript_31612/g.66061  ORF Transcript_31612/g.66061 Transcript_31612/m.66061 type:complete len:206 (+) Transcript_31612:640-1257(+)
MTRLPISFVVRIFFALSFGFVSTYVVLGSKCDATVSFKDTMDGCGVLSCFFFDAFLISVMLPPPLTEPSPSFHSLPCGEKQMVFGIAGGATRLNFVVSDNNARRLVRRAGGLIQKSIARLDNSKICLPPLALLTFTTTFQHHRTLGSSGPCYHKKTISNHRNNYPIFNPHYTKHHHQQQHHVGSTLGRRGLAVSPKFYRPRVGTK